MKITDEAVEAAAKAVSLDWQNFVPSMRLALEAALPHLTDDGAADTPPADTGVRSAQAAESATPVGAGAAAPSSPHLVADKTGYNALAEWLQEVFSTDEEGVTWEQAAEALFACGAVREGATPAIDREQIAERLAEAMADSWMGDEVDCADVATILTPAVVALIEGAQ